MHAKIKSKRKTFNKNILLGQQKYGIVNYLRLSRLIVCQQNMHRKKENLHTKRFIYGVHFFNYKMQFN